MSNRNERKYAVFQFDVDGDCDVEKATAAVASSPFVSNGNDGTTAGGAIASTPAAFLLPDGRMIGSKNTMQSFVVSPAHQSQEQCQQGFVAARSGNVPTNSHRISNYDSHTIHPLFTNDSGITGNSNSIHQGDHTIRAQAVPVQSILVAEGEIVDPGMFVPSSSSVSFSAQQPQPQPENLTSSTTPAETAIDTNKNNTSFWVSIAFAITLVAVVAGIGEYCGAGNCSASPTNSSNNINNWVPGTSSRSPATNPPTTPNPITTSPTTSIVKVPKLPTLKSTTIPSMPRLLNYPH